MLTKSSATIVLALFTICCIVGCGKKEIEIEDTKDYVYEETIKEIPKIQGEVSSFTQKDGKYFVCTEVQENEDMETILYQFDQDGNEVKSFSISPDKDIVVVVSGILVTNEDNIYLIKEEYNSKNDSIDKYVVMLDGDGNVLENLNFKEFSDETESLVDAQINDDGMIAIEFENRICILDSELNYKGDISIQNGDYKMSVSKDGTILVLNEKGGMVGSEKLNILEIDTKKLKCNKVASIKNDYSNFFGKLMRGSQYDFYYKTNDGIYGYNISEKKEYKVMDFVASYLSSDMVERLDVMPNGSFYDIQMSDGGQKAIISIYEKVNPEDVKDRITITYGGIGINEEVKKEALRFNRKNKEYQIVFKDYLEDVTDGKDPIEKMNLDITSGKVPDIIDLSISSAKEYEKKGLLVDLTEFINEDNEISKEDFLDNVWDAMLIDDKLCCAASGLYLASLVGNGEELGEKTSVSIDDIYEMNQQLTDGQTIFGKKSKDEILGEMLRMGPNAFVDVDNNKCDFDSDDFKTLLKFCDENGQEGEENNISEPEGIESVKEGKILFSECTTLTLNNFIFYNEILGDKVRIVGYPGKEEGYSYFRLENAIGIAATSEKKEVAWQFVRTFLTKEYQGDANKKTIPLRKDCFEMMKKAYTTQTVYTDELGQNIHPVEGCLEGVDLRPLTDKEMDAFAELIINTKYCMDMDFTINNIISEEAALFFDGEKSLDETVKIIQNRAQTYIDESK